MLPVVLFFYQIPPVWNTLVKQVGRSTGGPVSRKRNSLTVINTVELLICSVLRSGIISGFFSLAVAIFGATVAKRPSNGRFNTVTALD